MKSILIFIATIAVANAAFAQQHVNGYIKRDGTYVQPHMRTQADGNPFNNLNQLPLSGQPFVAPQVGYAPQPAMQPNPQPIQLVHPSNSRIIGCGSRGDC